MESHFLTLNGAQETLREQILEFSKRELNHGIRERDQKEIFSRDLWRKCGEQGLPGLLAPEECGGKGLDGLSTILALENLAYGCSDGGLVFSLGAHLFAAVLPIWKHGSSEQKRSFLPLLCRGEWIGAGAVTEPDAGSDIFSMATEARREGHNFRIRGQKTFISNAPVADLFILYARTDRDKGFHGGMSAFLVEKGLPGLGIGRIQNKLGLRTCEIGEITLDNVQVPEQALLGEWGAGGAIFLEAIMWERVGLAAVHNGVIQRLLETMIRRVQTRKQFGQPIGKFEAIANRIADTRVHLEASRLLTYQAASKLDPGKKEATLHASMAKLFSSESLVKTALDTVQIFGAYGLLSEYEIERALRDAVGSTIYSGTSEIQRNVIAKWLGVG